MDFLNFKIKNFKGIEDTTINFNSVANIYTLIGLNESGKTTVLEALNYWSYSKETQDAIECLGFETIKDDYELIPIGEASNFSKECSIEAALILNSADEDKIRKYAKTECNFEIKEDIKQISINKRVIFKDSKLESKSNKWSISLKGKKSRAKTIRRLSSDDEEWKKIIAFIRDDLLPTILYFPNFLFDFPEKIYLEDLPEESEKIRKEQAFYKDIIQDILDSLKSSLNIQTHIVDRVKSGDKNDERSLKKVLYDMEQELNKNILGEWNAIFKRGIDNKKIKVESDIDENNKVFLEFFVEDDGYFSINQRSLGFRWFFAFLLFTKYRGYRSRQSTNILFLLDEPASNLHTTAQQRLQKSLGEIAKPDYKFIYTTHSQYLINPKWLENTYIVKNEGLSYDSEENIDEFSSQKTKIDIFPYKQFVSTYPDQTSYFKPVLDIIDYRPSELDMIPDVVMVEGKNDFYTFKYFEEIIFNKQNEKYNFLPGLSSEKLFPLIQHYLAWGKNFIIILDGDKAGTESKQDYIKEFGNIVKNRIFSYKDISTLPKSGKLEDYIKKEDRIKIQQTANPSCRTYNKKAFNRTLQELYLTSEPFAFSDESKNNIKTILDFLDTRF